MPDDPPLRDYWAFISYSQIDDPWAKWLHRSLERYQVPKNLVGRQVERGHTVPKRVYPVFRDRDELPTAAHFTHMLETALRNSKYLIVICSPAAVGSRWVNEEIRYFKKIGREDRILYLIVDGEPCASDGRPGFSAEDECFPETARFRVDENGEITGERTEPIAADVRPGKDGKTNAKLKLLAGVLGVAYDELARRDQARRMRRAWLTTGLSLSLLAVMTTLAILFLMERNRAENALAARYKLAAREAVQEQEFGEAVLYYDAARALGHDLTADPGFAAAWQSCRNLRDQFRTPRAPAFAAFSADGSRLVVQDQLGEVQIRDLASREVVWRSRPTMIQTENRAFSDEFVFGVENPENDASNLVVRRIADLEALYSREIPDSWTDLRDFLLSPDGSLAYFRKLPAPPADPTHWKKIIHVPTGGEVKLQGETSLNLARWWFGQDGRRLFHAETESFTGMAMRVWETQGGEQLAERQIQQAPGCRAQNAGNLVLGFDNGFVGCQDPDSLEVRWAAQPPNPPAPAVQIRIEGDRVRVLDAMLRERTINLADGEILAETRLAPGSGEILALAGDRLLVSGRDGVLRLWQGGELQAAESWHPDTLTCVALSADGSLALAGAQNGVNRVWEMNAGESRPNLRVLRQDGANFRFFQASVADGFDYLFATDGGLYRAERNGGWSQVSPEIFADMAATSDGGWFGIRANGELVRQPATKASRAHALPGDLSGAARYRLAVGGGQVCIAADSKAWAIFSEDKLAPGEVHIFPENLAGKPLSAFRVSADGNYVLAAGFGGAARWNLAAGDVSEMPDAGTIERVCGWNGDVLLWRSATGALHLGNFATGKSAQVANQAAASILTQIDGEPAIVVANMLGQVSVQTLTGEQLRWFAHPQAQSAGSDVLLQNAAQPGAGLVFSEDGRYLATSHGFHAYLWDWRAGELVWRSPQIPAGMFGQLSVSEFIDESWLLVYEGGNPAIPGAPGAYLLEIPAQTPDSTEVSRFGREILGLELDRGLLREIRR